MIKYPNLSQAEVLMVLYNNATSYDGYEAFTIPDLELGEKMDIKQAFRAIDYMRLHFGHVYFRTLNKKILDIDLTDDKKFEEKGYNELNGLIALTEGENFAKNCLEEYWIEERLKRDGWQI